jgi:hypothetical protein
LPCGARGALWLQCGSLAIHLPIYLPVSIFLSNVLFKALLSTADPSLAIDPIDSMAFLFQPIHLSSLPIFAASMYTIFNVAT